VNIPKFYKEVIMMSLLIPNAMAQASGAQAQTNPVTQFVPFILIFVIFYFLMIRPQKKKLEEEQSMLSTLTKGDEIFTKSGLLGTIVGMTDKIITLEVAQGVKMKILRSQIGGPSSNIFDKKEDKK
jgi:preprotein translocase subunit YajC